MRPSILIVARQSSTLLGLANAILKFGYQIMTAYPEPEELDRFGKTKPSLVLLRPPSEEEGMLPFLRTIKERFHDQGVPVIACVATAQEELVVLGELRGAAALVGSPLRLNELHGCLQKLLNLANRSEVRIRTELVVAHREPTLSDPDHYYYDTMISLSSTGCFIETETPYRVGAPIELTFCAGSESNSLHLRGKVTRHGTSESREMPGMGVHFETMSDEDHATLESFLMAHIGTADMPSVL